MAAVNITAKISFIFIVSLFFSYCSASFENLYCGQDNCYDGKKYILLIFDIYVGHNELVPTCGLVISMWAVRPNSYSNIKSFNLQTNF